MRRARRGFDGTTLPETVFVMFQMTFAIITPALIVGAFVERIRFGAVMAFSMLWVRWFGFNAGSALGAGADAGMAMLVTHLSAAVASLVWLVLETIRFGKPSLVGFVTGTTALCAAVTVPKVEAMVNATKEWLLN